MNDGYSPLDSVRRALGLWWLLAVFILAGAAAGWGVHLLRPPIYESRASISISIDFARTGFMSDIEQDQTLGIIGDIVSSSQVLDEVVERCQTENLGVDTAALPEMMQLEREEFRFVFRASHTDPHIAGRVANLWAEVSYETLERALSHALLADRLSRQMDSLESCLWKVTVSEPVHSLCAAANLETILEKLKATGEAAKEERIASLGLLPAVGFSLNETAETASEPARRRRNEFIFSGALAGLLIGGVLIELDLPGLLFARRRRD